MSRSPQQLFERHGLTILIGVLVVGLLGVIGFEMQWRQSVRPGSALGQVARGSETSILPAFVLPPMETGFKETVERPLFMSTRRPAPIATAGQQMMKKGQFRLAGTIINQDLPSAFLVEIATGKAMRVAKGAEIVSSGISLATVDASRVVLKQGEETEELTLRTAPSPPAPTPAPAAAGVPGAGQRPPPAGVVVGGIPTVAGGAPPAPPAPAAGANVTAPRPGSSVLPGFVQSPPGAAAATPANPAESPAGTQRRRRFPNVPQQ